MLVSIEVVVHVYMETTHSTNGNTLYSKFKLYNNHVIKPTKYKNVFLSVQTLGYNVDKGISICM
jgi:hypothetical protein